MLNIEKILIKLGIEVPEDKKKELNDLVAENYKTVVDYDKQTAKIESLTESQKSNDDKIKKLEEQLKGKQDIDVDALNETINQLKADNEKIKSDYEKRISDRDFEDIVKDSISKLHGKNIKAIRANLDIDKLKESKNQREDIENAVKALSESDDTSFLFDSKVEKPKSKGKVNINNRVPGDNGDAGTDTLQSALEEYYSQE